MTTYPVPNGTEWLGDAGQEMNVYGAGLEVTGPGDWSTVSFKLEVRGAPLGGAVWDSAEWDAAQWVDPADDDLYTWIDLTPDYVRATWSSARRPKFGAQFGPGTAAITVKNLAGEYTLGGPDAVIELGQGVRITAIHGDTELVKFRGSISAAPSTETAGRPNLVTIQARSPLAEVARAYRESLSAMAHEHDLPGERLERILDSVVWPSSLRAIETGVESLQGTLLAGSALAEAQLVAMSEGGELFHDDEGRIVFYDRATVDALPDADPILTVADRADPGGAGVWIPYASLSATQDLGDIKNHATIGAAGLDPFTVKDDGSIARHGMATVARSDLLNETVYYLFPPYESWPEQLAGRLVAAHKDPAERFTKILLTGGDIRATIAVLAAKILEPIRVRRYAGATELEAIALLERIQFTAKPARNDGAGTRTDTWIVTLATSKTI